jgi:hypothetical protein
MKTNPEIIIAVQEHVRNVERYLAGLLDAKSINPDTYAWIVEDVDYRAVYKDIIEDRLHEFIESYRCLHCSWTCDACAYRRATLHRLIEFFEDQLEWIRAVNTALSSSGHRTTLVSRVT